MKLALQTLTALSRGTLCNWDGPVHFWNRLGVGGGSRLILSVSPSTHVCIYVCNKGTTVKKTAECSCRASTSSLPRSIRGGRCARRCCCHSRTIVFRCALATLAHGHSMPWVVFFLLLLFSAVTCIYLQFALLISACEALGALHYGHMIWNVFFLSFCLFECAAVCCFFAFSFRVIIMPCLWFFVYSV